MLKSVTSHGFCKGLSRWACRVALLMGWVGLATLDAVPVVSQQSGPWAVGATWVGGSVPVADDHVVIEAGHAVTLAASPAALSSLTHNGILTFSGWETVLTAAVVQVNGTIEHTENTDAGGTPGNYGSWTPNSRVWIVCGDLTVAAAGIIDGDARGYVAPTPSGSALQGRGPGGANVSDHGGGGTYGGRGTLTSNGNDFNRPVYGNPLAPSDPGSSGASAWNYTAAAKGGNGGGAIRIQAAGRVTVDGTISVNGQVGGPGGYTSGGGSGGSIFIECETFEGTGGTISARGGNGQTWSGRLTAAGGGGRVALLYDPVAQDALPIPTVTFDVGGGYGGHATPTYGEPGSLYLSDTRFFDVLGTWTQSFALYFRDVAEWHGGALTVDNVWVKFPTHFPVTFGDTLTVRGAHGKLEMLAPTDLTGTDLVITNGGRMYLYAGEDAWAGVDYGGRVQLSGALSIFTNSHLYPYAHFSNGVPVKFDVDGLSVAAGASIDASAKGYRGAFANRTGFGPPGGGGTAGDRGGGGGHGGVGGYSFNNNPGGGTYGSSNVPITAGSCGGNGFDYNNTMGLGGGVIWIEAAVETRVDGHLNANGGHGVQHGGGGAGGSIYLTAETFKGGGQLLARGGNGGPGAGSNGGGGGGGGRIAVGSSFSSDWTGTVSATNGTQAYDTRPYGEAGTIVFETIVPERPGISNMPPSSFSTLVAALDGYLFTTGRHATAATVHWGTTDGGNDPGLWQAAEDFAAPQGVGPLSINVALPTPQTMYYYRYVATNAGGIFWAAGTETFLAGHIGFDTPQPLAHREDLLPATTRVARAASATNGYLSIGYSIGGTGVPDLDYVALPGSIELTPGQSNAAIVIQPLYRELPPEGDKTIELALHTGNYLLGASNAVTLTLIERIIPPGANETLVSGPWGAISTWSLNRPPAPGDDVTIAHDITLDRGVGPLASLIVETNTTLTFSGGTASITSATVTVQGTLTHTPNSATAAPWTPDARVHIVCDAFTLSAGGAIDLDGKGYLGRINGAGYGPGGGGQSDWGGGGGHNNPGGPAGNGTAGGAAYGDAAAPVWPGSSGGGAHPYTVASGAGGGVLRLDVAGHAQIDGSISANGLNPPTAPNNTCGGGAGGSIYLTSQTMSGTGSFSAQGGTGTYYSAMGRGGAGSGGRIAIGVDPVEQASKTPPTFDFRMAGGIGGPPPYAHVGPGSLYLTDGSFFNPGTFTRSVHLIVEGRTQWNRASIAIDNAWVRLQPGVAIAVTGNVTVQGPNGRLELSGPCALICANLRVTNQAVASFYAGPTNGVAPDTGGSIRVAGTMLIDGSSRVHPVSHHENGGSVHFDLGNLVIESGGRLDADGLGFRGHLADLNNRGRGPGGGYASDVGSGAGHGSPGGVNLRGNPGGPAYGNATEPTLPGSAGGRGSAQPASGHGGGLVWIVVRHKTVLDGTISARGQVGGGHSGGGSGGSIYLRTYRLFGSGSLHVDGGPAGVGGTMASGGAGGRIAVWRWVGEPLNTTRDGGAGYQPGGQGTVFWGWIPPAGVVLTVR